jgi:hypothetical protein
LEYDRRENPETRPPELPVNRRAIQPEVWRKRLLRSIKHLAIGLPRLSRCCRKAPSPNNRFETAPRRLPMRPPGHLFRNFRQAQANRNQY